MFRPLPRLRLRFGLCLLAGMAGGCSTDSWFTSAGTGNMFQAKAEEPVVTRVDRLRDLRKLAGQLARASAERQHEVSLELAQSIRDESDPLIRAQILRTLSTCRTQIAESVLAAGVQDSDPIVRVAACDGLAKRGDEEALRTLSGVIASDADVDVRIAAARGLGEIKQAGAVEALAVALDDSNPALQYRAMKSLKQATGRDYGNDVVAWREFAKGGTPRPRSPPWLAWLQPSVR